MGGCDAFLCRGSTHRFEQLSVKVNANMDYKSFGMLITSLRKEQRNEFDEVMTQNDLAELAHMSVVTLQKIEQGRCTRIEPEHIFNIGIALRLPLRARQLLYLAATGFPKEMVVNEPIPAEQVLADYSTLISRLQTPAILIDTYGDVVMCNPAFAEIYLLDLSLLSHTNMLSRHNLLRWICAPEFQVQRAMLGESASAFIHHIVMLFKILSLKCRTRGSFLRLIPELNRLPLFRKEWQSPFYEEDEAINTLASLTLNHPSYGLLKFLTLPMTPIFQQDDLYLLNLVALDAQTAEACQMIVRKVGNLPMLFTPWPKPPEPGPMDD